MPSGNVALAAPTSHRLRPHILHPSIGRWGGHRSRGRHWCGGKSALRASPGFPRVRPRIGQVRAAAMNPPRTAAAPVRGGSDATSADTTRVARGAGVPLYSSDEEQKFQRFCWEGGGEGKVNWFGGPAIELMGWDNAGLVGRCPPGKNERTTGEAEPRSDDRVQVDCRLGHSRQTFPPRAGIRPTERRPPTS